MGTTLHSDAGRFTPWSFPGAGIALVALCAALATATASAQVGGSYRFSESTPPGAIGSWQLKRGGPLPGYYQPVEFIGPQGLQVAMAVNGQFEEPQQVPQKMGLLISPVYRFRVTNIPLHPGEEVFPTIEVVNRLYPPQGRAWDFPIQVDLNFEDLKLALAGKFVTRVIYLEDPRNALPTRQKETGQRWLDVGANRNPLHVADELGRPMAILRMGGRVPVPSQGMDPTFLGTGAPILKYFPARQPEEVRPGQMPRQAFRGRPQPWPRQPNRMVR